jgi:hypothetical protein
MRALITQYIITSYIFHVQLVLLAKCTKSSRIKWAGHLARIPEIGKHMDICGKARRKESLRIPRHRWVDNIKMDLTEVG